MDKEIQLYYVLKEELSIERNCVLRGIRVAVPQKLQKQVLNNLHATQPGIQRMKLVARSFVWWPHIDENIETLVHSCQSCKCAKQAPPKAPLQPWIWSSNPWIWLHIDFAGPFKSSNFLIVVDAHSKWPEIHRMSTTTAYQTIKILRSLFACHGIPD